MKRAQPARNGARAYQKSGVYRLKRAVRELGSRVLDRRTSLGKALAEWQSELLADLGGADVVSTQQLALVELAVRTKLLVDSVDAFVLSLDCPVNKKKRALHPVVRERQALVAQLQSLLRDLGLERKAREVADLTAYLAQRRPNDTQMGTNAPALAIPTLEVAQAIQDDADNEGVKGDSESGQTETTPEAST